MVTSEYWYGKKRFSEYIKDAFSQLEHNADVEYKLEHFVFTYTEDDIIDHIDYFIKCFKEGINSYYALTAFCDEIEQNKTEEQ